MKAKRSLVLVLLLFIQASLFGQCPLDDFLADISGGTSESLELQKAIAGDKGLVDSWAIVKNAPDAVKKNPKILSKIDEISKSGNGLSSGKITEAFEGDLGDVLTKASDGDLDKILARFDMSHMNDDHLDEIIKRLNPTDYSLKQDLLDNPALFSQFDDMLDNPGKYWEMLSDGSIPQGSKLNDWARGKWFKNLRELAEDFDKKIVTSSMTDEFGLDNVVSQVTLEVTSKSGLKKTIRIDNLAFDDFTGQYILGDAKFTTKTKDWNGDWVTSCTDNQKDVFKWFKDSDVKDIVVKATDSKKIEALDNINLKPDSPIDFSATNLRLYGSDAGQQSVKTVVNIK